MCFLVDDEQDEYNDGARKLQLKHYHKWLIPQRAVNIILLLALIFFFIGTILMVVGGIIGSTGLKVVGGILFAFGIVGILVCVVVFFYAYFCFGTKSQESQTDAPWTEEYLPETPGYASIGRPSALKSSDSTLKRNGTAGQKKVTMAPEVGPVYSQQPGTIVYSDGQHPPRSPSFVSVGSYSDGTKVDPRGVGGRSVGGSDVGTGGIRILPADQPFPSPAGSQVSYITGSSGQGYAGTEAGHHGGYGASHGTVYVGGSSASSSLDTYAYPKSVSIISGNESGYAESGGTGSQYSTLRSIPVQHVISSGSQHRQQTSQQEQVEYARVNKQGGTVQVISPSPQRGYIYQGQGQQESSFGQGQGGFSQGQSSFVQGQSSFVQGQTIQGQGHSNQFQQSYSTEDFDYDNPVERTPMIPPKQNASYHQQQMHYQRQQQMSPSELYTPRQLNTSSLQRQQAANPYALQQHQQQQQQQQQQQTKWKTSQSSSNHFTSHDDIPEPQPLVYPSARRPMTFEQISSSKMSMYDNVLAGLKDAD